MIINEKIRSLVATVEAFAGVSGVSPTAFDMRLNELLRELVRQLHKSCARPENVARYAALAAAQGELAPYPLGEDGFARAYDVLTEETAFFEAWSKYGVVVGRGVVPPSVCEAARERVYELARALSGGRCDFARPETWDAMPVDAAGVPLLSRGFFEVYHDDALAQLRQAVRAYVHHVVLWGRADLWCSFDRFGVKLPGHGESAALPLHTDPNPRFATGFRTVQGILALVDCPAERGTFVAVPGSKSVVERYAAFAPERGEYAELDLSSEVAAELVPRAQPLPLRAGDLVSWDSRTTHANTANVSADARVVALIAAGPSRENDPSAVAARAEAVASGLGSNVRDALMHASKKPRYTAPQAVQKARRPERLTILGELLYGQKKYQDLF